MVLARRSASTCLSSLACSCCASLLSSDRSMISVSAAFFRADGWHVDFDFGSGLTGLVWSTHGAPFGGTFPEESKSRERGPCSLATHAPSST